MVLVHVIHSKNTRKPHQENHTPTSSHIINDPRPNPRIPIIVLIKIPHRPPPREPRQRRVRRTEHHLVLVVEKVGRVPREMRRRPQTVMRAQRSRSPFPDAAIGALASVCVEAGRRTDSEARARERSTTARDTRNTYGTGCQFRNATFVPPVWPTSYVSKKSRSSGSVGSRPPLDLAYAARPSYDVNTGQCLATLIGTGPYSVRTCVHME